MRKLTKAIVALGLSAALSASLFIGEAHASWGAARLAQFTQNQATTATQAGTGTTTPATSTYPTRNWWSTGSAAPDPSSPEMSGSVADQGSMTQDEILMLQLINEERAKSGLKPLQPMAKLNELAQLKSKDIIENNYFSHISPTYGSFASMVYNAGVAFRSVGENLAKARNAQHAFSLFMASSGHRANILNPNFTHVGLGVLPDKYGVVVTQLFIMQ